MPRVATLLLTLGLLVAHTPAGHGILQVAVDLLSSNSLAGDPNPKQIQTPPEETPDSGWEMDPNG